MGVSRFPFQVRIILTDGETSEYSEVEEFVAGFKYLYLRTLDKTISFDRNSIYEAWRRTSSQNEWMPIAMRHQKTKKRVA